jgi:probable F420-dependent oxidoreductase
MKVRIGFMPAAGQPADAGTFAATVDALEDLGFDSLWLSERVSGPNPDPIIGLAVAAGRTTRMKLGTSVQVLPGRNPALLAQELASLDVLSGGRFLPGFGLGGVDPHEQQAFGVTREERAPLFDEVVPLLRRIWTEDVVTHVGPRYSYADLRVRPRPVQRPPDIWFGGRARSELRRIGRLGDGWLASFAMPEECAAGRPVIEATAAEHGRTMDPEHYGAMVFCADGPLPDELVPLLAARNPDVDPRVLIPAGLDALRARCEEFIAVGFSKLVVVPMGGLGGPGTDPGVRLREIADAVLDLET